MKKRKLNKTAIKIAGIREKARKEIEIELKSIEKKLKSIKKFEKWVKTI